MDKVFGNLQALVEETQGVVVRSPLPCLRLEEVRIQQLLQNLIGDALKYPCPGVPPRVENAAECRSGESYFADADNGV